MKSAPEHILLSGGWGYGNLGDDAILHASLNLLALKFPQARISIFSYSPEETDSELKHQYTVADSVHRLLFGDSAFQQLSIYGKSRKINQRSLYRRAYNRIRQYFPRKELVPDYHNTKSLDSLFSSADMFIMTGGGYFNNWRESLISRCTELRMAQSHGLDTYIIGQTLDTFENQYLGQVSELLKKCNAISVRDTYSHKFLDSIGIKANISPDLALSGLGIAPVPHDNDEIVFVPAELPLQTRDLIVDSLARFANERQLRIRIAVTRLYNNDISCAFWVRNNLQKKGIRCSFEIPYSFEDITSQIVGSQFIVSRNLHGLILGYIGGGKILCLNDQWKFKGFMRQIQAEELIAPINQVCDPNLIMKLLDNAYSTHVSGNIRKNIALTVQSDFNKLFDK